MFGQQQEVDEAPVSASDQLMSILEAVSAQQDEQDSEDSGEHNQEGYDEWMRFMRSKVEAPVRKEGSRSKKGVRKLSIAQMQAMRMKRLNVHPPRQQPFDQMEYQ